MKLCLSMIVKNEAPRIERCLSSVVDQIDTWAILDTGSTDNTVERIYNFFEPRKIPGTLVHGKFVNFSHTRNEALALANTHRTQFDYLLLIDADMELVGEIPQHLTVAAYHMLQKGDGLTYWNTRLIRSDIEASYQGVTHEYLSTGDHTPEKLFGPWFLDHADGGNRPGKIERDIKLLGMDVAQHPGNARSWYYLGQSYREAGHLRPARIAYNERIKLGGWDEETFHAQLSMARCYRDMNADEDDEDTTSKFIRHAVAAYQMRPTRAEPLYDLARYYRDKGANTAALLFALAGRAIPKPNDLLFVEDYPYEWGFKEEISICGFYSKAHRGDAHGACEELALSRDAPQALRDQSWSNLFHYTRPLSELAPSFAVKKIEFEPPDGYRPMNPSIVRLGERMVMNVRTVNYLIGADGRYQYEGPIKTRNFLLEISPNLKEMRVEEVIVPPDFPCLWGEVLGLEDVRLFPQEVGELRLCATARQQSEGGLCEIVTAHVAIKDRLMLTDWRIVKSPEGRSEKNWIPIIGKPDLFIYKVDPLQLVDDKGRITASHNPPIDLRHCSGSTQAIPFDGGYLTMVHERQAHLDSMHGQRNYQQRFLWLDDKLEIRKISRRFMLSLGQGEFPCGMCMHPDGERLVISYGVLDREAFLATVDADEVGQLLRHVGERSPSIFEEGPTALAMRIGSAMGLETFDKDGKAMVRLSPYFSIIDPRDEREPIPPAGPFADEISAVTKRAFPRDIEKPAYNSVLKSEAEVRCAIHTAESYGWPIHPDFAKNWDVVLASNAVLEHTKDFHAWIVDAGADRRSTFLPTLQTAGYHRLWGVNLLELSIFSLVNGISYAQGNIENMELNFSEQPIDFIACLSTIEHGVNIAKFLRSAYRCLKPGGHLFVSTDIWKDPIVTAIRDWRIFTPIDIMSLVTAANQVGLATTSEVSFAFGDRVAHHAGLNYTFINLLFRKDG